jgi:tetratricopeptide (TPR) repeat protein
MPTDSKLFEAAEGYLELGLGKPALESLEQLSSQAKRQERYLYHSLAAESLRLLERYDDALPHLIAAKEERPSAIPIYVGLGWCYKRIGQLKKAIEMLQEAEQVARSQNVPPHLALILYNLACYHSLAGEKGEMLGRLREALSIEDEFRRSIADESDFDPFRNDPDFVQLVSEIV